MTALMASGLIAAGLVSFMNIAAAAPVVDPLVLKNAAAATSNVETVRWRGRGYGGFAAGAIVGGAFASRYYYPGPSYYYEPYYAPPPPPSYYGSDDTGYCMSRFRSYDPRSGTYMGNDGRRHPCP
jgi:hypothetical protein